jgi:hypothetical protein
MIELNTFRFRDEFQDGVNILEGLYDLITEVVKPNFKIVEIGCWCIHMKETPKMLIGDYL